MAMQQPYTLMDSIDVAGLLPSGSKGPVYVLQSDINSSGSHIAVSLSDQSIQVFSVAGGAGGSRGVSVSHSRSINARSRSGRKKTEDDIASSHRISDIQFSPADPHVLYSCSTDCHVTVWDTRTSRSSASWRVGSDAQALAATANGRGLAVATEAPVGSVDDAPLISLWDLRAQNRLHLYEGIHSEPISQLSWHPNKPQMLLSTAEDGLLCALDATASDPDDALGWCCNFETPVRSFGFFGPGSQHACALTCNESVQLCRLGEDVLQAFPDVRQKFQTVKSPAAFDYLVTSRFQQRSNRLLLLAGTNAGRSVVHPFKSICFVFRLFPFCQSLVPCQIGSRTYLQGVSAALCFFPA
eukprot:INCI600.1.p1 GENE.INCI600.1~~INCI600.1.p1  ORF type:complete len:355 (-),score=42.55 INCI600.1:375-1439(-)